MALSTRIVTRHTTLFAALLAAALMGTIWVVTSIALSAKSPSPLLFETADVRTALPTLDEPQPAAAYPPSEVRASDRLCGWTADQVFLHHRTMLKGGADEFHGRAIVDLTEAYLDMRCPNRIHDGSWYTTAEILGVGLVGQDLRAQPWFHELGLRFDPRADNLVGAASHTFEILAPHRMCFDAARGVPALEHECLGAMGLFE